MAARKITKTERKVLKLIEEARNHEAYMTQDGTRADGSGLSWLEFAIKNGRLTEEK